MTLCVCRHQYDEHTYPPFRSVCQHDNCNCTRFRRKPDPETKGRQTNKNQNQNGISQKSEIGSL